MTIQEVVQSSEKKQQGGGLAAKVPISDLRSSETLTLGLVVVLVVVLYAPTLLWLLDRWTLSVWQHAHGLFIPPIVGYLVWQRLRLFRHLPREANPWGFAMVIPALALHVLDVGIHTQILSAVSIVLLLPGMSLLFLGLQRTKSIAFLLIFLGFMLPIPLGMTQKLHLVLRDITANNIAVIVPALGVPIFVDGTLIHLPKARLLVADACSGFSTLYAMTAVACLTLHISQSRLRSVLVILVTAPIAIAANTLRSILLVVAVYLYGVEVLETWIHSFSGMFSMVLALVVIFSVGGVFSPALERKRLG